MEFLLVVWWPALVGFTAWLAREKGRSALGWGALSVPFPGLALLALIGAPRKG